MFSCPEFELEILRREIVQVTPLLYFQVRVVPWNISHRSAEGWQMKLRYFLGYIKSWRLEIMTKNLKPDLHFLLTDFNFRLSREIEGQL